MEYGSDPKPRVTNIKVTNLKSLTREPTFPLNLLKSHEANAYDAGIAWILIVGTNPTPPNTCELGLNF